MNPLNPKKLLNSKWTAVKPRNKEKHFLVTEPMPEMTRILKRKLGPEEVYEADSDAAVRRYLDKNLPPGAPRIGEGQQYSWTGFTLDARTTVVKLEALLPYYRCADPETV